MDTVGLCLSRSVLEDDLEVLRSTQGYALALDKFGAPEGAECTLKVLVVAFRGAQSCSCNDKHLRPHEMDPCRREASTLR